MTIVGLLCFSGDPIYPDENCTVEDLRLKTVTAMTELIDLHQTKPGNYFRAINERLVSEETRFNKTGTFDEDISDEEEEDEDLQQQLHPSSVSMRGKDPLDQLSYIQDDKSSGFGSMHDSCSSYDEASDEASSNFASSSSGSDTENYEADEESDKFKPEE